MAAKTTQINAQDFISQTYQTQDLNLMTSFDVNTSLSSSSYIEFFIYDNNQNLLSSDYNFTSYTIINDGQSAGGENVSEIILDPEKALIDLGYNQGEYTTFFNFCNKQIGSPLQKLYITEISSDRTELRLDSTDLTNPDIVEQTTNFITERENSSYFLDFYLDFEGNKLPIANNIRLDNSDPTNPTILIKLYEALPEEFSINSQLWIITLVEESRAYQVVFEEIPIIINDTTPLKGPNFNLDLKDQINNSTQNSSYEDLVSTSLTSSLNQLNSLLEEKELDINIDYTNFSDFVHFSSLKTRLENFYYKVQLIEQYSYSISILNNTTNSSNVSSSKAVYESQINDIITNFDGYDYYLYYSSGSYSWPKSTTEQPYQLYPSTDDIVLYWLGSDSPTDPYYGGMLLSASIFDKDNPNNLYFSIPEYLRDDANNDQYLLFTEMVGQHYDNIWVYYKDVTQKYNADNRLEYGISKDIIADAIRDFGVKLYQNNFSTQDLYTAFLGLTPEGGLFPFPNITSSLPTPSGYEYVDTLISASNDYLPLDDVNKSLYKRIYHNLPYLLKSKGTLPGLRALITSYGIPDTILRINEYGGKDKVNLNDWDYWQDEFNYAFNTKGGSYTISTDWYLNPDWNSQDNVPSTVAFRFKTDGFPGETSPLNQSLWDGKRTLLTLTYTGSGHISGSYSGSIIDPYYQYATLTFLPDYNFYPNSSASIYLPFFDDGWWSVMITRNGNDFTLYAGNKIYEGGDNGTVLGFFQSSSITEDSTGWTINDFSHFNEPINPFSEFYGSYQEIRYYTSILEENTFKDYIMNPYSIEGNSLNSGPDELAFRASLGGELYTGSVSIHPKVTGSWIPTSSFNTGNSDFLLPSPELNVFDTNREYFFYDQPIAGIKNAVSNKIRLENDVLPAGDTLSPFRPLAQTTEASASYTPNINLLEVAFSPQDEINDDINSSIGYFNIGNLIGDPAYRSSRLTSYTDLDKLRNEYFEKYTKNYDLVDYIRLIKFFDNSLFKMIKDFVPARTSLASGVVIKQTLLERNRYPQPQVSWGDLDITGTLKPTWNGYEPGTVENFGGGTGGSFERFNYVGNVSQSWYETVQSPLGLVVTLHNDQDEFYDGEFSGSVILVTTQSLNQSYPLENISFSYTPILFLNTNLGQIAQSTYASNRLTDARTIPQNGEIMISIRRKKPSGSGVAFLGVDYIKIAKKDTNGNDSTIPLGQITNLLIKYSNYSTATNYQINNITEYSTYYLYDVEVNSQYSTVDNYVKNYKLSGSIVNSQILSGGGNDFTLKYTASIDTQGVYTQSLGTAYYPQTTNIKLDFTASFTGKTNAVPNIITMSFGGTSKTFTINSTPTTVLLTGSIYPYPGEGYIFTGTNNGVAVTMSNFQFLITQSVTPIAAAQDFIILEPYISVPNFYNSDYNAVLNNIEDERLSTIYQDVDYSTGILTPTNFSLLISGSATKAPVQDSNYTTKRHIIPRYDGSKSTSQNLNKWTLGDTGTYGKLPTVESSKTYVAYSDNIGGWAPEKMNTSGVSIKYLISEDGDLIAPNTSLNSLGINQQNFVSGENVTLQSLTAGTFAQNPSLSIFRGGASIEPILYNQIRHYDNPPMSFSPTLSFSDRNPGSNATINDYTATLSPSNGSSYYAVSTAAFSGIYNDQIVASGSSVGGALSVTNAYSASLPLINENLDLVFEVNLNCLKISFPPSTGTVYARIIRKRSGVTTPVSDDYGGYITPAGLNINFTITIPRTDLQVGDEFSVAMIAGQSGIYYKNDSTFKISTNPYPTPPLNVTNLFTTSSIAGYENYMYTTSSQFIQYLNSSNIYQQDIEGSGFNPITLPVSIQKGDEFRFEGDETKTFMVGDSYVVSSPLLSYSVVVIVLNHNIAGSNINLNEFVLRRYVDNAGGLILNGLKPSGFNSPYLIKPEYMSEKMEKNIGKYIENFTNKGLL